VIQDPTLEALAALAREIGSVWVATEAEALPNALPKAASMSPASATSQQGRSAWLADSPRSARRFLRPCVSLREAGARRGVRAAVRGPNSAHPRSALCKVRERPSSAGAAAVQAKIAWIERIQREVERLRAASGARAAAGHEEAGSLFA
jgi:hypothetical protein